MRCTAVRRNPPHSPSRPSPNTPMPALNPRKPRGTPDPGPALPPRLWRRLCSPLRRTLQECRGRPHFNETTLQRQRWGKEGECTPSPLGPVRSRCPAWGPGNPPGPISQNPCRPSARPAPSKQPVRPPSKSMGGTTLQKHAGRRAHQKQRVLGPPKVERAPGPPKAQRAPGPSKAWRVRHPPKVQRALSPQKQRAPVPPKAQRVLGSPKQRMPGPPKAQRV